MKYVYKNVTQINQSVLLASKNQESVSTRLFTPGATLELDYPGLNLYVPNLLSCTIIGIDNSIIQASKPVAESVIYVEPVDIEPKTVALSDFLNIKPVDAIEAHPPKIKISTTFDTDYKTEVEVKLDTLLPINENIAAIKAPAPAIKAPVVKKHKFTKKTKR